MVHAIERALQTNVPEAPVPLHDFIERATLDNIGIGGEIGAHLVQLAQD